ncbi:MAG: hypothetical protein AB7E47_05900 [Desulfovibrionaceae bacterium]
MLQIPGKKSVRIEVFDAGLWPDKGGKAGLCRLRRDGRWVAAPDGGDLHLDAASVGARLLALLGLAPDRVVTAPPPLPEIPDGTLVRVPTGEVLAGQPLYEQCRISGAPILAADGRWQVMVCSYHGKRHVAVDLLVVCGRPPHRTASRTKGKKGGPSS